MEKDFIIIENETKIYRIKKDKILSVTVNSGIVTFLLENESISRTMTLKSTLKMLPEFIRINHNCAINPEQIKKICKKTRAVTFVNNEKFQVSIRKIQSVCNLFCEITHN